MLIALSLKVSSICSFYEILKERIVMRLEISDDSENEEFADEDWDDDDDDEEEEW